MFYNMKCNICGRSVRKDTINCPVCGNRIHNARDIKNNEHFVCNSRYNKFSNNPDYYNSFFKYHNDKKYNQQEAPITLKTWIIAFLLGLTIFGGMIAGAIEIFKGNTKRSLIYITSFFWSWTIVVFMIFLFMFITISIIGSIVAGMIEILKGIQREV